MTLKVEQVKLEKLKPYRKNPRKGNVELIAKSLDEYGQYKPITVRRETGEILAGNHTYMAAKSLGWAEISVAYIDVDDETAARIVLIDNRSNDLATYDNQILLELLESLPDLGATGYDDLALESLNKTFGAVPDLDDLLKEIGEPTEEDTMTRVSFMVPPEVAARWEMAVKMAGSGSFLENTCTAIQAAYEAIVNE